MRKSWVAGAALVIGALLIACPSPDPVDPPVDPSTDGGDAEDAGATDGGGQDAGAADGGVDAGRAPAVIAKFPAANATAVALDAGITATFDLALDPALLTATSFTVGSSAGLISGTVSYDETSRTAWFEATDLLPEGKELTATLTTAVRSAEGVALASEERWSFTTETLAPQDTTPPTVTATTPDGGATDLVVSAAITADFSEDVQPSTVTPASFTVIRTSSTSNSAVAGAVTFDATAKRATFTPSAPLMGSSTYLVTLGAGIRDAAGNALVPHAFSFSTEADTTAPTVVATSPANGTTATPLTQAVSITVNEPLNPSTVNVSSVSLSATHADGGTDLVYGVITWDEPSRTIGFVPSAPFEESAVIAATLTTDITDLAGNALGAPYTFTFSVNAQSDAPTVSFTVPPRDARLVPRSASVKVTFNEDVDATTVNATNLSIAGRPAAVTYDAASRTATLTPNVFLPAASPVTVTVKDVKDSAGTSMAAPYSWTFRTLGDAVKLSADALPDVRNLSVAEAAGNVMAVWHAFPGVGGRLQWALRQGTSWTGGTLEDSASLNDVPTLTAMGSRFGVRVPVGITPQFRVFNNGAWTATADFVDGTVGAVGNTGVNVAWSSGAVNAYTLATGSTTWVGPTPIANSGSQAVLATSGNLLGVTYRVFASASTCKLGFKRFDGTNWSQFEAAIATVNSSCATLPTVRLVGNGTTFFAGFRDGANAVVGIYDVQNDSWTTSTLGAAQGPVELATNGQGGVAAFYRTTTHIMASTWSGTAWSTPVQIDTNPAAIDRVVGWSGGYAAFRNGSNGALLVSLLRPSGTTNTQLSSGATVLSAVPRSDGVAVTYGAAGNTFLRVFAAGRWSAERKLNIGGASRAAVAVGNLLLHSDGGAFHARELQSGGTLGAAQALPIGELRGSAGSAHPAIRPDGAMLVAWSQYDAGDPSCFIRYFDGANWGSPSKLPIRMVGPPMPERCVAATNGRVFVIAWIQELAPASNGFGVFAARWTPDAGLGTPISLGADVNASDLMARSNGSTIALVWSSHTTGRGSGDILSATTTDAVSWASATLLTRTASITYEPLSFAAGPAGYVLSTYAFGSTSTRAVAFGGVTGTQNLATGTAQVAAGRTRVAAFDSESATATLYLNAGSSFSPVSVAASGSPTAIAAFGSEFRLAANGNTFLTSGTTVSAASPVDNWTTGEVSMKCDVVGCGMFGRSSPNFTELRTHYTAGNRLVLLGNVLGNAQAPQLYFEAGRYGLQYLTYDGSKEAFELHWIWD